jgi:hypothetical protein
MTGSKRRAGLRRGRVALLSAVAASAVMAFGASSANAAVEDFHATFDDAALNVGLTFDILDPPETATMDGTYDTLTNQVNVPANQFVVPQFEGDPITGVHVIVNFHAVDPIVGTLNSATGDMSTTASTYQADVDVNGNPCQYVADMAFTTNDTGGPFTGDPFTVTTTPGTPPVNSITNGDLQTSWSSLPADPDTGCGLVNTLVANPGGLAMGNGVDLTPPTAETPPPPPATTPAKKKKCKKGFVKKKVKGKKKCVKKKKK